MNENLSNVISSLAKKLKLSNREIKELQIKEDLFASFLKFTPSLPSDLDCNHYKTLDTQTMSVVNDLLKAGFDFEEIKGSEIWLEG